MSFADDLRSIDPEAEKSKAIERAKLSATSHVIKVVREAVKAASTDAAHRGQHNIGGYFVYSNYSTDYKSERISTIASDISQISHPGIWIIDRAVSGEILGLDIYSMKGKNIIVQHTFYIGENGIFNGIPFYQKELEEIRQEVLQLLAQLGFTQYKATLIPVSLYDRKIKYSMGGLGTRPIIKKGDFVQYAHILFIEAQW